MSAAKATAGVSAKQRAANQANAEESTGPRTTAGKTRSAKNATTHGIYARPTPVPGGEFAEDSDEIDAFTQQIVDSLVPRNGLERMVALTLPVASAFRIGSSGRDPVSGGPPPWTRRS